MLNFLGVTEVRLALLDEMLPMLSLEVIVFGSYLSVVLISS